MKTLLAKVEINGLTFIELFFILVLLAGVHQAAARGTRFFRISGPSATMIAALRPAGSLVGNNALTGTNYIVQTVVALPGGTNWVDYVQLLVTNAVNTNLLVAFNPPAGMAFIPAGVFTRVTSAQRERSATFTPLQRAKSKRAGRFTRCVFLAVEAG